MIKNTKRIAYKLGFDKAIMFTSSASILGALGSVISVLLVVRYLTGVEQGFYYTFGSIVSIQIFFELGLNGIITQYVAHEASNLKWQNVDMLFGDSKYISRLASLLHFSVKWYLFFAVILLISLIIVGFIFFNKYDVTGGIVSWGIPWLLLSIGTGANLIASPIVAFIQGLGKVKEIAKIQLIVLVFRLIVTWGGLVLGAKLYVLGVGSIVSALILMILTAVKYRNLLINIWKTLIVEKIHYKSEIFPLQWKIALSWISGYFIFQLFNPVLFATEGAVVAGQMGMTLAALNGITALSLSWISTKIPLFSGLIALKDYDKLDSIFNKTLSQSALINGICLLILLLLIFVIKQYNVHFGNVSLVHRFLDYLPLILMMIPVFINQYVSSWAIYLRCHKQEPYMINSIVTGILCVISTLTFGSYYGVIGLTSGYFIIRLLTSAWAYKIYKVNKLSWHVN